MNSNFKLFLIPLFFVNLISSQNNQVSLDSIINLRELSRDKTINFDTRLEYASLSSSLARKFAEDSTVLRSDRIYTLLFLESEDYVTYVRMNQKNLKFATKLKDTSSLAIATYNLCSYYRVFTPIDSAFYYCDKSLEYYSNLDDSYNKAQILFMIATMQENQKDYLAAEENAIESLKLFETIPQTENVLWYQHVTYDLLASIAQMTKNYEKSINYFDKSIELTDKYENGESDLLASYNNKAWVLRKMEKFEESLKLYNQVLNSPNFFNNDPGFYALVLDNIAYTRFVRGDKDYANIEMDLKRAYKISDSIDDDYPKIAAAIDLSKVFEAQQKLDSARVYAQESLELANKLDDNVIKQDALLMLSKSTPGDEGKKYLYQHIALSDSLLNLERTARNKFARIKYETDQIEKENEVMTRQRQWLLGISAGLLLTSFLIYIIITQRAKNKELRLIQDQQKANEEIYNLMLTQQDKVEEARANEKKRISQEIHDGVLGKMFGVRLSLDSLNFNTGPKAVKSCSNYLNELKTIEEEIRQISHDLNTDFVSGSSFIDILEELIEKQSKAYNLEYKFNHEDDIEWEKVNNKTKINLYRVIQESLQNIYKHAEASEVEIGLFLKNNVISLSITDDGKGFDVSKSKKGIGIKNITSRILEIEGEAQFKSSLNRGTTVDISVPYST